MTELKDVIHLYIGSQIEYFCYHCNSRLIGKLTSAGSTPYFWVEGDNTGQEVSQAKLICSRLSDMTEEDEKSIALMVFPKATSWEVDYGWRMTVEAKGDGQTVTMENYSPDIFIFLLSKGYWLFGDEAFDKGLVIDKNTLKTQ